MLLHFLLEINLPINCDEISTLSIGIVDQNGDLVNLRGENVVTYVVIRDVALVLSQALLIDIL